MIGEARAALDHAQMSGPYATYKQVALRLASTVLDALDEGRHVTVELRDLTIEVVERLGTLAEWLQVAIATEDPYDDARAERVAHVRTLLDVAAYAARRGAPWMR